MYILYNLLFLKLLQERMLFSHGPFIFIVLVGMYFVYIRPKINVFSTFQNDPNFTNYMLIIESNKQFDTKNYDKFMKHIKLFLMYYSQSYNDQYMFDKMKTQHNYINKYLNRMLFSIPNSMRRYTYMKNAIDNLDLICKSYLREVADKYDIQYVTI